MPPRKRVLVCQCVLASDADVVAAITAGARTIEEIGARCDAGTGCTSCHALLEELLQRAATGRQQQRAGRPQLPLFGDD